MTFLTRVLLMLLVVTWAWLGHYVLNQVEQEKTMHTKLADCQARVAIYNDALDALSRSKWEKRDTLYTQAQKAERGRIKP